MTSSLRERLRNETRAEHEAIEAVPLIGALSRPELTRDDYVLVLARFHGLHAPLEEALRRIEGLREFLPDLEARMRTPALVEDLRALGFSGLPEPAPAPLPRDLSEAFGALYVLEGSTLGGQVIKNRLEERELVPEGALHYYGHRGDGTGLAWRRFLAALEEASSSGSLDADRVVASARATFRSWTEWMNRPRPLERSPS